MNLDLRHLGEQRINERLPFIRELAQACLGVDPVLQPVPVRPTAHYTMGGIQCDLNTATVMPGLYAVGECASSGLHGANRLGSNSLAELCVMGRVAGEQAASFAAGAVTPAASDHGASKMAKAEHWETLKARKGTERLSDIREALANAMEEGVGIYRSDELIQRTCNEIVELKQRYQNMGLHDSSYVFNTEWLTANELGFLLDVGEAMAHSALQRKESRGSHQRLDGEPLGWTTRDDTNCLKHSPAFYTDAGSPRVDYQRGHHIFAAR